MDDADPDVDAGSFATWYTDADGDGFGDPSSPVYACEPADTVANADDCDDADPTATLLTDWYADGFGDGVSTGVTCTPPAGLAAAFLGVDCDEADDTIYPGATEICDDGVDQDCDGLDAWCTSLSSMSLSAADANIAGDEANGTFGRVLEPAGLFDADAMPDILITGSVMAATGGRAYVYSSAALTPGDVGLGTAILTVEGAPYQFLGTDAALLGDLDGDGLDDLALGAPGSTFVGVMGSVVLVHGGQAGTLLAADASVTLMGENSDDLAGQSVAGLGDATGDGIPDLLVGAPGADRAYFVDGTTAGIVSLSLAAAVIDGKAGSGTAFAVAGPGDVDGDGLGDALIGSWDAKDKGSASLLLGPMSGLLSLTIDGHATLLGEQVGDGAGQFLSDRSDLDGDGYADMVVGAASADKNGVDSGVVYVVRGPAAGLVPLAAADATIVGGTGDLLGAAAAVGDVDGDGSEDLLVGSGPLNQSVSGSSNAVVLLGPISGWIDAPSGAVQLSQIDGLDFGARVGAPDDVNLDGWADLLVGSPYSDELDNNAGAAFLIYGARVP